jgi:phosphoglycolate phosphatase-like HAD superfamily hydrolase
MVGDSFRDVDAGLAAGCRTLLVHPERYDISTRWVRSIVEMPDVIRDIMRG